MNGVFELFSPKGRYGRAEYWGMLMLFLLVGLPVAFVVSTASGYSAALAIAAAVLLYLPWLAWGFVFNVRRLHDRDKSGWWVLVFSVLPTVLDVLAAVAVFQGSASQTILTLAGWPFVIWGFVEIGCLRGTEGPNQYGPDPLATAESQQNAVWGIRPDGNPS